MPDWRPQGSEWNGMVDDVEILSPFGVVKMKAVPCLCCGRPTIGRFTTIFDLTYAICPDDAVAKLGLTLTYG